METNSDYRENPKIRKAIFDAMPYVPPEYCEASKLCRLVIYACLSFRAENQLTLKPDGSQGKGKKYTHTYLTKISNRN
jgi:hypothetical protein